MTAARCRPTSEHELTARKIRLGTLVLLVALFFVLAGCAKAEPEPESEPTDARDPGPALAIFTDQMTSCEYLAVRSSGRALTPRIAADGKSHMGCKGAQP